MAQWRRDPALGEALGPLLQRLRRFVRRLETQGYVSARRNERGLRYTRGRGDQQAQEAQDSKEDPSGDEWIAHEDSSSEGAGMSDDDESSLSSRSSD